MLGLLLAIGLAATGCGKSDSQAGAKSFDKAAPEIKAVWDSAVAADKANDYVAAVTAYNRLSHNREQLSEGQSKALEAASRAFFQRLMEASRNGNPAAQQAFAALRDQERGARQTP